MDWETQLCREMGEWKREAGVPVREGGQGWGQHSLYTGPALSFMD